MKIVPYLASWPPALFAQPSPLQTSIDEFLKIIQFILLPVIVGLIALGAWGRVRGRVFGDE